MSYTVKRKPRIQGFPPILPGSTVIRGFRLAIVQHHDTCSATVEGGLTAAAPRLMPQAFPSTAQSALIGGRTPGPQPTPPSARRSVDDADFIGEKRVQGDPRGPGGPPHNFGRIRSFGKKLGAL